VIALAFIVAGLLFVCGAALVPERLPRPARLVLIVAAPFFALFVWRAVHAFEGWPVAASAPPSGATFLAADVREPSWIYVWLTPRASARPRAYRLRYSDDLYAQVLKAQQQMHQGMTVKVYSTRLARRLTAGHSVGSPGSFELRAYREPPVSPPLKTH
jgi:hypothetical protein